MIHDYLKGRGLTDPSIIEAAQPYEESGRIWFPWFDAEGNQIGKNGRRLHGDGPKKWIYPSGSRPPLYASPGAWEAERVGLVETVIDALLMAQAGTPAFAAGGNSLIHGAAEILATKKTVILCCDQDGPGSKLREDFADKVEGPELLEVQLPPGHKDIGEVAEKAEDPADAVALLVDQAQKAHLPPKEKAVVGRLGIEIVSGDELAREKTEELESLPFLGRVHYIIRGFAHLIASYPKTGKTTLLLALLTEWLRKGLRILYFTEEPRLIWEQRLSGDPDAWKGVSFVFGFGANPKELLKLITSGEEEVVVVDTLRSILQFQDETDNSAIARDVVPWIAACRPDKTFIGLAHDTKAGGEHGRGIAGGHALFGLVDMALEIQRVQGADNRRSIKAYGRVISPSDLLYEMDEDGDLVALGDPHMVALEEVADRVKELLGDEWQTKKQILDALEDPKPSAEGLRRALVFAVENGLIVRDPVEDKPGARYRWRNLPTTDFSKVVGRFAGTNGEKPDLDTAVANVLEIFPGTELATPPDPDYDPEVWLKTQASYQFKGEQ